MNTAIGVLLAVVVWLTSLLTVRACKPEPLPEAPPAVPVVISGMGEPPSPVPRQMGPRRVE